MIVIAILSEDTARLWQESVTKKLMRSIQPGHRAYFKLLCLYVVPFLAYLTELTIMK
ncbi:hypothetical protein P692DRAFT_20840446 [Suillus brevipes Sb2]|nr:hypothetical protein P692DRAFT_20840446 [Suillus brevipes Sb2]